MSKITILLADNDTDFLATRREYLELAGYAVVPAQSPAEARQSLDTKVIDLAIFDIRLMDDDDKNDVSGIVLANDSAYRAIPKIILTGYPSADTVRKSLKTEADGKPNALDFVAKDEGPEEMLSVVRRIIGLKASQTLLNDVWRYVQHVLRVILSKPSEKTLPRDMAQLPITAQLLEDYQVARKEVVFLFWVRLIFVVIFILLIVVAGIGVLMGQIALTLLSALPGIFAGMLAGMFNKLSANASRRWELFHKELVRFYGKEMDSKAEAEKSNDEANPIRR